MFLNPSEEGIALLHLYNVIASKSGGQTTSNLPELDGQIKNDLATTAEELLKAKGKSLVVCGSNDENAQLITNAINLLLDNYGSTLDFNSYSNQRQGDEKDFIELVADMEKGNVGALIVMGSNPAYDCPNKEAFKSAIEKVSLTVSLNRTEQMRQHLCVITLVLIIITWKHGMTRNQRKVNLA